jgi:hypothetical protein
MPGFGALVVIFLFGLALVGIHGTTSETTTFGSGFNLTNGPHVLTPVGGGSGTTDLVLGDTVSDADDGRTITLSRHAEDVLILTPGAWSRPRVTGKAVRLEPFGRSVYFWTIDAVASGTATITAARKGGGRQFAVTVRVR